MPEVVPLAIQQNESKLDTLWASLQAEQTSYLSGNGRYLQLLKSSDPDPSDGVEVPSDRNSIASGHSRSWANGGMPVNFPFSVECHEYDGPNGKGYIMISRMKIGQTMWVKRHSVGNESRSSDWVSE